MRTHIHGDIGVIKPGYLGGKKEDDSPHGLPWTLSPNNN